MAICRHCYSSKAGVLKLQCVGGSSTSRAAQLLVST